MNQISDEFVNDIKQYVTLDDQLKETQTIAREIRKKKTQLSLSILNYMDNNGIQNKDINLSDGKLKYFTSKTQSTVNKKFIENSLALYYKGNYQKAKEVTEFIFSNREVTEKTVLKRTRKKQNSMNI